jgi:hypothetical protein
MHSAGWNRGTLLAATADVVRESDPDPLVVARRGAVVSRNADRVAVDSDVPQRNVEPVFCEGSAKPAGAALCPFGTKHALLLLPANDADRRMEKEPVKSTLSERHEINPSEGAANLVLEVDSAYCDIDYTQTYG